ncbi:aminoglycoside 6-adenylyltransferase [Ammoniphilus sp. 3BR4]|uniref:aminoglycoside 6-adenylyltransferase n=1 Tax=Ammoniphilus sp. 3BR4 TaxID=3158265 RepID=UPI00346541B2
MGNKWISYGSRANLNAPRDIFQDYDIVFIVSLKPYRPKKTDVINPTSIYISPLLLNSQRIFITRITGVGKGISIESRKE